ncbi:hypothetical protein [Nocardia asiatica]|uniref:hypothetical protein n=1 Tax=Nocardia asiatica TaxID=209252 RepID=UPI0002D455E7|nr:hypothetical protein [Nocardia asiatica]
MSTSRPVPTALCITESAALRLADRAAREGTSCTALLDRLIHEGVDQLDHPGIVFRGPLDDRRAALAADPGSGKSLRACVNWTARWNAGSPCWARRRI